MSKLYTTLVMAKLALNDGRMPPMTPIPEQIRHIINPEYVAGLGALNEEDDKGLQCPVCGVWLARLTLHINAKHDDIGGAKAVRKLLGVPATAALWSQKQIAAARLVMEARSAATNNEAEAIKNLHAHKRAGMWQRKTRGKKLPRRSRGTVLSVGTRNLRNTCDAQIGHRLWDLRNHLGRSPTWIDVNHFNPGLGPSCKVIYGTWNAAKALHGLDTLPAGNTRHTRRSIVEGWSGWVEAHGCLPSLRQRRLKLPLTPSPQATLKYLKADTWAEAMRKVAVALGIHDARYRPAP